LVSISPDAGVPGQSVAIQGAGFMSADGMIIVTFGVEVAPTQCPTQEGCVVTVPPGEPGQTSVPVQLKTAAGESNILTFRYSSSSSSSPSA
jgi:hypothetical protein